MKKLLKLENLGLFILFSYLELTYLNYNLFVYLLILFLPDIGMIGYLINPRVGSWTYNLTHHLGVGVLLLVSGIFLNNGLRIIGSLILAHSSLDRVLGFGLKHPDSFKNTHLGKLK